MRETSSALLGQVIRLAHSRAWCADEELVRRYVEDRDERAFEMLVSRHGPMVLRLGKRMLGNLDDAEDVFQATFLVLTRQAGRLRKQASVGSWLYGVASRLARKAIHARQRRHAVEDKAAVSTTSDPVREITLREAQAAFDDELTRLPEKLRGPLVLCYLEGMTRDEAAGRQSGQRRVDHSSLGCDDRAGTAPPGAAESVRRYLHRLLARRPPSRLRQ